MGGLALQARQFELDDRHVSTWRDEVCDQMLNADSPWNAGQRLGVHFGVTAVHGIVQLEAHVEKPGLAIARSPTRVARDPRPVTMGLTLVTSGEASIMTRGTEVTVGAGELCLLSTVEPFEKRMSANYREMFLYLPIPVAMALGRPVPQLAEHRLVAQRRGLGAVLADAMESLARAHHELDLADWQAALGAVFELSAGVFGRRAPEQMQTAGRDVQRARALRFIDTHLTDPELSPPAIAAALGVSLRYLHLLFEGGDSLGATVLARRLERCRTALLDPGDRRSISEIAFAFGFNDAAHFSRSFRARFGIAARDLRRR